MPSSFDRNPQNLPNFLAAPQAAKPNMFSGMTSNPAFPAFLAQLAGAFANTPFTQRLAATANEAGQNVLQTSYEKQLATNPRAVAPGFLDPQRRSQAVSSSLAMRQDERSEQASKLQFKDYQMREKEFTLRKKEAELNEKTSLLGQTKTFLDMVERARDLGAPDSVIQALSKRFEFEHQVPDMPIIQERQQQQREMYEQGKRKTEAEIGEITKRAGYYAAGALERAQGDSAGITNTSFANADEYAVWRVIQEHPELSEEIYMAMSSGQIELAKAKAYALFPKDVDKYRGDYMNKLRSELGGKAREEAPQGTAPPPAPAGKQVGAATSPATTKGADTIVVQPAEVSKLRVGSDNMPIIPKDKVDPTLQSAYDEDTGIIYMEGRVPMRITVDKKGVLQFYPAGTKNNAIPSNLFSGPPVANPVGATLEAAMKLF